MSQVYTLDCGKMMSQQKKQWNIPHSIEKYTISNIKLARLYLDLARGERRNLNK